MPPNAHAHWRHAASRGDNPLPHPAGPTRSFPSARRRAGVSTLDTRLSTPSSSARTARLSTARFRPGTLAPRSRQFLQSATDRRSSPRVCAAKANGTILRSLRSVRLFKGVRRFLRGVLESRAISPLASRVYGWCGPPAAKGSKTRQELFWARSGRRRIPEANEGSRVPITPKSM